MEDLDQKTALNFPQTNRPYPVGKWLDVSVVVQFCPWFKFYFSLCLGMIMYDNEFETMRNKI